MKMKRNVQKFIKRLKRTLWVTALLFVCIQLIVMNNNHKNAETREYVLNDDTTFLFPSEGLITAIDKSGSHENNHAVDIANDEGTPILAAMDGVVAFSGVKDGYGNCIIISHKDSYSTLYAHLNNALVKNNQMVQKGEEIGLMGSTGNSTGSHLHFEVRINEKRENILKYFPFLEMDLVVVFHENELITEDE